MKGNPLVAGGLLISKPTWVNTIACLATSVFFVAALRDAGALANLGSNLMQKPEYSEHVSITHTYWDMLKECMKNQNVKPA